LHRNLQQRSGGNADGQSRHTHARSQPQRRADNRQVVDDWRERRQQEVLMRIEHAHHHAGHAQEDGLDKQDAGKHDHELLLFG